MPRGDTSTGRHGAKERSSLNGQKNSMPLPPLVKASSAPCEATAANRKRNEARKPARSRASA
jgi:hypothetical protein